MTTLLILITSSPNLEILQVVLPNTFDSVTDTSSPVARYCPSIRYFEVTTRSSRKSKCLSPKLIVRPPVSILRYYPTAIQVDSSKMGPADLFSMLSLLRSRLEILHLEICLTQEQNRAWEDIATLGNFAKLRSIQLSCEGDTKRKETARTRIQIASATVSLLRMCPRLEIVILKYFDFSSCNVFDGLSKLGELRRLDYRTASASRILKFKTFAHVCSPLEHVVYNHKEYISNPKDTVPNKEAQLQK